MIVIETLHTVGRLLLTFVVLPTMDPVSASVAYMAVLGSPPIFDLIDKALNNDETISLSCNGASLFSIICPAVGFLLQFLGMVLVAITLNGLNALVFLIGAVLISIKYWENYVSIKSGGILFSKRSN